MEFLKNIALVICMAVLHGLPLVLIYALNEQSKTDRLVTDDLKVQIAELRAQAAKQLARPDRSGSKVELGFTEGTPGWAKQVVTAFITSGAVWPDGGILLTSLQLGDDEIRFTSRGGRRWQVLYRIRPDGAYEFDAPKDITYLVGEVK